jgi:hypothetical protein
MGYRAQLMMLILTSVLLGLSLSRVLHHEPEAWATFLPVAFLTIAYAVRLWRLPVPQPPDRSVPTARRFALALVAFALVGVGFVLFRALKAR